MKTSSSILIAIGFSLIFFPTGSFAQNDKDVALILKTGGTVGLNKKGMSSWSKAKRGQRLHSKDKVRTGKKSLAALVFTDDKSLLKVRSNSSVTINGQRQKNSIAKRIQLTFGELWAKVTKQNVSMRIETPSGVATVKGTEFYCSFADGVFLVFCREGLIELSNQFGTLMLASNEMAELKLGSPPKIINTNPNDVFDMSEQGDLRELEIQFEDENGNKKSLIIDFN